jgi:hypothetical protein
VALAREAGPDATGETVEVKLGPGNVTELEQALGCPHDDARTMFEAEDPTGAGDGVLRTNSGREVQAGRSAGGSSGG